MRGESRPAPRPDPSRCLRRGSAARDSRSPATAGPCAGRGGTRRVAEVLRTVHSMPRVGRHRRSTSMLPSHRMEWAASALTAKTSRSHGECLKAPVEKASVALRARSAPSASGGHWPRHMNEQLASGDSTPSRTSLRTLPRSRVSNRDRRQQDSAGQPGSRSQAGRLCIRRLRIRGSADRTSGPASGHRDPRNRRPALRAFRRGAGAAGPRTARRSRATIPAGEE